MGKLFSDLTASFLHQCTMLMMGNKKQVIALVATAIVTGLVICSFL